MINLWHDFPSPERFYFKSSVWAKQVSVKQKSLQSIMVNVNHQAKFIETRHILQTGLNLVIFGKKLQ